MEKKVRSAAHKGSWYTSDPRVLSEELGRHLAAAKKMNKTSLKAVICPHAGYAYSAPTAAFSYKQIDPHAVKTVFLLGPTHHIYLRRCGLPKPSVTQYETPLGNLDLHTQLVETLRKTNKFEEVRMSDDEDEHSLEMQLPFIKKVWQDAKEECKIVPILVGDLEEQGQSEYADILLPYFKDPEILFVVSSDFCHWGKRFRYTYIGGEHAGKDIHHAIEALDHEGIDYIVKHDIQGFIGYLQKTHNTICGQNPIKLLLRLIEKSRGVSLKTQLLDYTQSSKAKSANDSSVSYASLMTEIN